MLGTVVSSACTATGCSAGHCICHPQSATDSTAASLAPGDVILNYNPRPTTVRDPVPFCEPVELLADGLPHRLYDQPSPHRYPHDQVAPAPEVKDPAPDGRLQLEDGIPRAPG